MKEWYGKKKKEKKDVGSYAASLSRFTWVCQLYGFCIAVPTKPVY